MQKLIKNIIFDLGNVLVPVNYQKTLEKLKIYNEKFFNSNNEHTLTKEFNKIYFDYETGKIDSDFFLKDIRDFFQISKSVTEIDLKNCWNAMILDFPCENVDLLLTLREKYRIFLLSNTNLIHIEYVNSFLQTKCKQRSLEEIFHETFYSCNIGYRKPHEGIYNFALQYAGIKPDESIFIDDLPENTKAAERLGIQIFDFSPANNHLKDVIKSLKLL